MTATAKSTSPRCVSRTRFFGNTRKPPARIHRGETVTERGLPAYQPLGIRAGGFLVFPKIEVSEVFDDNIFVDPSGEVHDFLTYINPSITVRSNFPRHELNFWAIANIGRYASEDGEDFEDYEVGFDGRIDAIRDANLFGGVVYAIRHEGRGSPDDVE